MIQAIEYGLGQQYAGRLHRLHQSKQEVQIYDYIESIDKESNHAEDFIRKADQYNAFFVKLLAYYIAERYPSYKEKLSQAVDQQEATDVQPVVTAQLPDLHLNCCLSSSNSINFSLNESCTKPWAQRQRCWQTVFLSLLRHKQNNR